MMASGQRNNTKAFARLTASSKTRLPRQGHLESWSVRPCSALTLQPSPAKLNQQRISHQHVVTKTIVSFPEKVELPTFILPTKMNWPVFSCGFAD